MELRIALRQGAVESPCHCGSGAGIHNWIYEVYELASDRAVSDPDHSIVIFDYQPT